VSLLNRLAEKSFIIKTPPQDYDDSYCIQYAKKMNGFIVTNDKFRDYLKKLEGTPSKKKESTWLKEHIISYTFKESEFLPNPDSRLFDKYPLEDFRQFPLEQY
jgi:hypothetical protein